MQAVRVGGVTVHHVEHGSGRAVLVLHGAGVDHREAEACFEPCFDGVAGFRRIYPDLPGMGRTAAPGGLRSAEDVLEVLLHFAGALVGSDPFLLVGHSAGGYFARAMATRAPVQVAGLALVCPLLPSVRDVPEHRAVVETEEELGDSGFRSYFVVQTPEMLERYERLVTPAEALVDQSALERIGERWELPDLGPAYSGPTLVVAGRLDSTVGFAAAADLVEHHPHATLAVVDDAGHALPHEQPELLRALVSEWLARVERSA